MAQLKQTSAHNETMQVARASLDKVDSQEKFRCTNRLKRKMTSAAAIAGAAGMNVTVDGAGRCSALLARCVDQAASWCDRKLPVLKPMSAQHMTIRRTVDAVTVYIGLMIPVQVAFAQDGFDARESPIRELNLLVDVMCLVDMLVKGHTGYFDQGRYIGKTALAATHYASGSFMLDFVCAFPYPWLAWAFDAYSLPSGLFRMMRVLFALLPL
eukprot:5275268-Prymnesium_polylepis.1